MAACFLHFGTATNSGFETKEEEKDAVEEKMPVVSSTQIQLRSLSLFQIKKIYMGNNYCICTDNNQNFWAAGNNKNGQCAVNSLDKIINFTKINYFKANKIEIKNVYVNTSGNCTFWITKDDVLYGNGWNKHMQLGISTPDTSNIIAPIPIRFIRNKAKHITDIKSAFNYTLILLKNGHVLSTAFSFYGGNGHQRKKFRKPFGFKRIWFGNENRAGFEIAKIAAGYYHSLFLDNNQTIWSCGKNNYGQLGLGHNKTVRTPTCINALHATDICCGGNHNVAVAIVSGWSYISSIYTWGANKSGQCGTAIFDNINTPIHINIPLNAAGIPSIKCGRTHSYVGFPSIDRHYLFGNNSCNQCGVSKEKVLKKPVLMEHENKICDIFLGYENTIIMMTKIYDNSKMTQDDEKKEDLPNKIKMKPIWEYETSKDEWKEYNNEMQKIIESMKVKEIHKFNAQQIYKTTKTTALHIVLTTGKTTEIRRIMKYEDQSYNTVNCSYYNIAKKILEQHFPSIPKESFDDAGNMCYCSDCHAARGDGIVYRRGEPPKKYALPVGFARFGLKLDEGFCKIHAVFKKWHVCYHGTDKHVVPQIFHGRLTLLKPGDVAIGGNRLGIRQGHIKTASWRDNKFTKKKEFFDPNQIYISPSVKYSARRVYAKSIVCKHPLDNNTDIEVQFVFQCRIRPGSYKIGQETVGATKKGRILDENFPNDGIEWYTEENVAVVVHGLLLRFKET